MHNKLASFLDPPRPTDKRMFCQPSLNKRQHPINQAVGGFGVITADHVKYTRNILQCWECPMGRHARIGFSMGNGSAVPSDRR
jgi:hypothetical protein